MKGTTELACAAVVSMLALSPSHSAEAATAPNGSYSRSCTAIAFNGATLKASCSDGLGNWTTTTLLTAACSGDISNNWGHLYCFGGIAGGSDSYPCRFISFNGTTLRASCFDGARYVAATSISDVRQCSTPPRNIFGVLSCFTGFPVPADVEWDFSFAQSCANPYVDLNLSAAHVSIAAKCRTMAGGWLPTTIEAYPCYAGGEDIANSNGHLTCDGGTPAGSYTGSCAGISLAGTTLTARCADVRGASRTTGLMIERCTDDISNLFGHLACSGGVPTGSYLASCTSATLMRTGSGVTLFAQCSDGIAYQPTTSLLYSSCLNDPVNVLGSLSCDLDGGSGPSPPGSYRASCIIPELSGTTLGAVCRNASGSWGPGGIILDVTQCTRDIANVDGVLTCVQG